MSTVTPDESALSAPGGWCAPSAHLAPLLSDGFGVEIPEITVSRGGPDFKNPPINARPKPVPVVRDPRGHWEYGVDISEEGEEPEIVHGYSSYDGFDRFTSEQEAREYGDGTMYKRWVPAPGPWDEMA